MGLSVILSASVCFLVDRWINSRGGSSERYDGNENDGVGAYRAVWWTAMITLATFIVLVNKQTLDFLVGGRGKAGT